MAVAFSACTSGDTTGTSLTFSHTCAANTVLYVCVGIDSAGDFNPSVTYNGDAMTLVAENATGNYTAWFRLLTPDTGSAYDVVVSGLPSGGDEAAIAISLTGVDSGDPDDAPVLENVTTPSTSISDTVTTDSGDMVLSFYWITVDTTTGHAATGGATLPTNGLIDDAQTWWAATYIASDAASETPGLSWTNNSPAVQYSININAAAGGGDPEGQLVGGKLTSGGLLLGGVLVR